MSFPSNKLRTLALHRRIRSEDPKASQKVVPPKFYKDDLLLLPSSQPPTFLRSELCNICREIDFEQVADGKFLYKSFYLNPKEQQCVLCSIVLHFLHMLSATISRQHGSRSQSIRVYVDFRVLNISTGSIPLGRILVSRPKDPLPDPGLLMPSTSERDTKAITELSQLGMKEVEKWLHDCSCNHLACSQVKDKDTPLDIFLIDVVNRQIVPKRSDCQYLALSYVWGGACTFHLTKPRLKELQEQGALLRHINAIPQVIRDAMRFTDQINVQYLWVDSLCIIQDDPIHRDPQITHMNVIYRHAFATIINISGQNAESRLPGVSLGSRSTLKPIKMRKGVELQAIAPSLDLAILSSTYESRAWTYQERMLSSRCLYFTDWQVYFQCRSSLRSEDNEPVQIAKRHLVNPILEFETRPQAAKDYFWLDFFRCYDSVVRNYTQRQLSDDEDKLRAFSGIASTLDESGGGTFHYGLPGAILDLALLWIPAGPMEHYCPRKYDEASCTDYLPTWSWAGWQGAIEHMTRQTNPGRIDDAADFELPEIRSEISSFQVESHTGSFPVQRDIRVPYQIITYPKDTYERPMSPCSGFSGPVLCFTAQTISVVDFRLRTMEQYIVSPLNQRVEPLYEFLNTEQQSKFKTILCNATRKRIGLLMDSKTNCSWPPQSPQFELVLLSRTRFSSNMATSSGRSYCPNPQISEADALNVMLIRWTHRGLYAERVAVGTMIESAWMAAGPIAKLIRLI